MLTLPNLLTLSRILAVPILVFLLWRPAPYRLSHHLRALLHRRDHRLFRRLSGPGAGADFAARPVPRPDRRQDHGRGGARHADGQPQGRRRRADHPGLHVIPALVILLREIIVSGLREFLAPLNVSMPVSALAKWKTTFQLVSLGALILGGAFPASSGCTWSGIASLWAAAALTLVTGYDYLRIGLKHMD